MVKSKFSIALHIATLLAYFDEGWQSSIEIARSLNINPVLVRKELSSLKSFGIIESKEGKNGGVRLLKTASEITLGDIFRAVKGDDNVLALSSNLPDMTCKIGGKINEKLLTMFDDIDNSIVEKLDRQTLKSFKDQF